MNLREIDYFLNLCEEKSISGAARKLFITQQGLSKALKKMEEELEFSLFERSGRTLVLTNPAQEILQYALEVQKVQRQMGSCIERIQSGGRMVRVGTTMGVALSLRPTAQEELRALLAPASLEVVETTDFLCEDGVESGVLDFGVTVAPVDTVRFCEIVLKRSAMYAVLHKSHPLAGKAQISFADLKHEQFITASQNFKSYFNFIEGCRRNGFEPIIHATTMEMMVIYTKVVQNLGVGISADMPHGCLNYPGVVLVPFSEQEFPWQLSLIFSKKRSLSEFDQFARDALIQTFH